MPAEAENEILSGTFDAGKGFSLLPRVIAKTQIVIAKTQILIAKTLLKIAKTL